ncbi:DUF1707 domain-containing protein [Alloalcanivorax gelatiniphagus]
MGGFRAKDADRDRFVELIEAAYVDGQIGTEDRELRVSRALSAETLDELQTLTRDLQLPEGYVPPAPPQEQAVRPQRLIGTLVALGLAVALIGVAVVALVLFAGTGDDPEPSTGVEVISERPAPVPGAEEPTQSEVEPFEMTAGQVSRFLRRYEAKFGTLDAWDVSFYPARVSVDVPVRGSRPRYETWSWDGAWERMSGPRGTSPSQASVVDLGRIGPARLIANIRTAERTLDVQRGNFSHAVLWPFDEVGPTLNIHVSNTFGESGYLRTTLAGDRIVPRLPYGA